MRSHDFGIHDDLRLGAELQTLLIEVGSTKETTGPVPRLEGAGEEGGIAVGAASMCR